MLAEDRRRVTAWLLNVLLALTIGGIVVYIHWDLTLPHRWSVEREAYEARLRERAERRPFDEAWAAWVAEPQSAEVAA